MTKRVQELETKLVENDSYYQKKNAIIHEISSYEKVVENTRRIVFNIYEELDIEEEYESLLQTLKNKKDKHKNNTNR